MLLTPPDLFLCCVRQSLRYCFPSRTRTFQANGVIPQPRTGTPRDPSVTHKTSFPRPSQILSTLTGPYVLPNFPSSSLHSSNSPPT